MYLVRRDLHNILPSRTHFFIPLCNSEIVFDFYLIISGFLIELIRELEIFILGILS